MSRTRRLDSSPANDDRARRNERRGAQLAVPAPADLRSLGPEQVLRLQRTVGNQALAHRLVSRARDQTAEELSAGSVTIPELRPLMSDISGSSELLGRLGRWAIRLSEFLASQGEPGIPDEERLEYLSDGMTEPEMTAEVREYGERWCAAERQLRAAIEVFKGSGPVTPAKLEQMLRAVAASGHSELAAELEEYAAHWDQLWRREAANSRGSTKAQQTPLGQVFSMTNDMRFLSQLLSEVTRNYGLVESQSNTSLAGAEKRGAEGASAETQAVGIDADFGPSLEALPD